MRLVAQRVVQPGTGPNRKSGVNAFCYLHGERFWLDTPPEDLGRGDLASHIVEVNPPSGNRVRSFLEITAPDSTPSAQIAGAVQAGTDFLADAGSEPPWQLSHGEVAFAFDAEAALAVQWQIELRILLGYALAVRRGANDSEWGAGILSGDIFQP